MEDKTTIGISDAFRKFIAALVEEVVLNGEPFEEQKKWLRKHSEAEGVGYATLEKNLTDFFETLEELKSHESKAAEHFAKKLGKDCYLEEGKVDELLAAVNKAREKAEEERIAAEKKAEKKRIAREKLERELEKAERIRNGYGVCDYGNGRYEGNFKDGKFNGFGTLYFADGSKYVGNWKDGNCWGQGTLYNSDGTKKYEGNYENNVRQGQGTMYYDSGDRYEGGWKDNKKDGQGTYYWADGDKYVGSWKDNKKEGWGTYYFVGGDRYEGNWKDDKRNGQGVFYWADGDVDQGKWIDNKREGEFIRIKVDGRKLTAIYNNDEIIGKWEETEKKAQEEKERAEWLRKEIERLPVFSVKDGVVNGGGNSYYRGEIIINDRACIPTKIKDSAFHDYHELTAIYIPPTITEIGKFAFCGCHKLTAVLDTDISNPMRTPYENGITSIVLPKLVTRIEDFTFNNCRSLKTIIIPPTVNSIGESAFSGCSGLISLAIHNSVINIGKHAFYNCEKLKFLVIGRRNYETVRTDLPSGVQITFLD